MWTFFDPVFLLTFWAGICGNLFLTGTHVKHSESVFSGPSYINVDYYEREFMDILRVDIHAKLSWAYFHVGTLWGRHLCNFLCARIRGSSLSSIHMNLLSQHSCEPFMRRCSCGHSLTRHSHKFHWAGLRGTTLDWHSRKVFSETFLLTFFSELTSILILFVLLNVLGWFIFLLGKIQANLSSWQTVTGIYNWWWKKSSIQQWLI